MDYEKGSVEDPPADVERWCVRSAPDRRGQLASWGGVLAETHVLFETQKTEHTPDLFTGAVTRRRIGDLALVDCECQPFRGRNDQSMAEGSAPVVGLQSVRCGHERVSEPAGRSVLHPGDVKLWPGWEPVDIEVLVPFRKRTLIIPLDPFLAVCPRLSAENAFPPIGGSMGRLLVRYLDIVADELPHLEEPAAATVADTVLELLRAAVEPKVPSSRTARRTAMRAELRRYIRRHLRDPDLTPESIARAHALSVRALYALFEDTEESVAGIVRKERLTRCREDLERSRNCSIREIASRWGFTNAAHFSRAFKQQFGLPPSDVPRVVDPASVSRRSRDRAPAII